jgi:hypothetical protein
LWLAVTLAEEIAATRAVAERHTGDGEEIVGIVPAEPGGGRRVYLCAYALGEERAWLALDPAGEPVSDRSLIRDAVSIAALCELAEESAGGGDVDALLAQLGALRERERPEGIEEAERAAVELAETLRPAPRVASLEYLDALGTAAARLEQALGEVGGSPFAEAMKSGLAAADDLSAEVERRYKLPLS